MSFSVIEAMRDSVAPNAVSFCRCTIMCRLVAGDIWITARG